MTSELLVTREVFLGFSSSSKIAFYALAFFSLSLFVWGVIQRYKKYRLGREYERPTNIGGRIIGSLKTSLSNITVIRDDPYSGVSHLFMMWGFLILLIGTMIIAFNFDILSLINKNWNFWHGSFYLWFSFLLDLFGLLLLIGIIMMALRRVVWRPRCLDYRRVDREIGNYDRKNYVLGDWIFLGSLFVICVSGFLLEGIRITITHPLDSSWSFVGKIVGEVLSNEMGIADGLTTYRVVWWLHGLLSLIFIAYIPFSKGVHIVSDFANIFFDKGLGGEIPPFSKEEMNFDKPGYIGLENLTWKELLDLDSCTKCGRCHTSCPAVISGLPLSPRDLILDLRDFLSAKAKMVTFWDSETREDECEKVVGGLIRQKTLWSCTTCLSCTEHCPVFIRHLPLVIKMRRHMIEEGIVDEGIQSAFINISECGNSFGEASTNRGKWKDDLSFRVKDIRKEPAEVLWFVGDFASFDNRAIEATKAFASVLDFFGVDFGILYDGERNAGNDIRRIGEEGLFEELSEHNSKTLKECQFAKVVTTDPHSMNTLKFDYSDLGHPILHHTELLNEIIRRRKILPKKRLSYRVTYHDPCYLGRYSGIYESPRNLLENLGVDLVEMSHSGRNSLCCGAGGGRVWMSEKDDFEVRLSHMRIKEAQEAQANCIVVSCPKCLVMFEDALKAIGLSERIIVRDISELVLEAFSDSNLMMNYRV